MEKNNSQCKKSGFLLIAIILCVSLLQAQTYFAGAAAGTGNTNVYATAVGPNALSTANSGYGNAAFGNYALKWNTTGAYNGALGSNALTNNTSGNYNTASGYAALYSNTTGNNNVASGYKALFSNTVGANNIAAGYQALYSNISGNSNVATGLEALSSNTSGSGNFASGPFALRNNTSGGYNIALGYFPLYSNTTGAYNISLGYYSLFANTTGANNTANGAMALYNNSVGNNNVAMGDSAGLIATGSSCAFLGSKSDVTTASLFNATAIGFNAKVNASNKVVVGNTAVTSIGGQVGWTTFSDSKLKTNINKSTLGLNFILQLKPVTYNYKAEGQKDILYTGLLAQEVDAAARQTGTVFSGVDKTGEYWGIRYGELTVPLIKAVQEQNEKIMAAEEENKQLKERIEKLEKIVELLQSKSTIPFPEIKAAGSVLYQNNPNPYSASTTIKYSLLPDVKNAQIIIRNMNGISVKQILLNVSEKGETVINGREMPAGTYTCSLYTNGQLADTKLMIQTK